MSSTHCSTGDDTTTNAALACRYCGWPEQETYEVVSRHRTSEGTVVYSRCACGALQVRVHRRNAAEVVAARGVPNDM